jgi:hypothetical protein
MPASFALPPEFADAAKVLRADPHRPASLALLRAIRAGRPWSPRLPRRLLRLARWLRIPSTTSNCSGSCYSAIVVVAGAGSRRQCSPSALPNGDHTAKSPQTAWLCQRMQESAVS